MSLDERIRTLELLMEAALFSDQDNTVRKAMIARLNHKYSTGSCGDGSFDRMQNRANDAIVDGAINFCKYGIPTGG